MDAAQHIKQELREREENSVAEKRLFVTEAKRFFVCNFLFFFRSFAASWKMDEKCVDY